MYNKKPAFRLYFKRKEAGFDICDNNIIMLNFFYKEKQSKYNKIFIQ